MTSNLRDRATAAAAPNDSWPAAVAPGTGHLPAAAPAEPLEPVDAPEGIDADPADVPVQVAVARAMRDLGKIGKGDRYDGGGTKYNFRGVDRVVNAVAPVQRKHGLIVVPEVRAVEYRDLPTKNGGRSHECVVTVAWHWVGPRGDELVAVTQGEALDTSDKASAKAQSVAWRVCLIQMLAIPTGDPDPDSIHIERGEQPMPKALDFRDEIADPRTSLGRLKQIRAELRQHNLSARMVTNDVGEEESLLDMVNRIGLQRQNAGER